MCKVNYTYIHSINNDIDTSDVIISKTLITTIASGANYIITVYHVYCYLYYLYIKNTIVVWWTGCLFVCLCVCVCVSGIN